MVNTTEVNQVPLQDNELVSVTPVAVAKTSHVAKLAIGLLTVLCLGLGGLSYYFAQNCQCYRCGVQVEQSVDTAPAPSPSSELESIDSVLGIEDVVQMISVESSQTPFTRLVLTRKVQMPPEIYEAVDAVYLTDSLLNVKTGKLVARIEDAQVSSFAKIDTVVFSGREQDALLLINTVGPDFSDYGIYSADGEVLVQSIYKANKEIPELIGMTEYIGSAIKNEQLVLNFETYRIDDTLSTYAINPFTGKVVGTVSTIKLGK